MKNIVNLGELAKLKFQNLFTPGNEKIIRNKTA